VTEKGKLFEAL